LGFWLIFTIDLNAKPDAWLRIVAGSYFPIQLVCIGRHIFMRRAKGCNPPAPAIF